MSPQCESTQASPGDTSPGLGDGRIPQRGAAGGDGATPCSASRFPGGLPV